MFMERRSIEWLYSLILHQSAFTESFDFCLPHRYSGKRVPITYYTYTYSVIQIVFIQKLLKISSLKSSVKNMFCIFYIFRLELSKRVPCLGINEKPLVSPDTQSTTTTA